MFYILSILTIIWVLLYIYQIYKIYKENSKPYISEFLAFSLREVPSNRKPNELSMLMDRKIGIKTFVSTFFYLIEKNIILEKKIEGDVVFTYLKEKEDDASLNEKYLLSTIFGGVGGKKEVRLSEINTFSKTYSNRTNLLMEYTIWKKIATSEIKEEFFEKKKGYMGIRNISIFAFLLILFNLILKVHNLFIYALCLPVLFLYFYFKKVYKRTKQANTEYFKWTAYKRYILNLSGTIKGVKYSYLVNLIGLNHIKEKIEEEEKYKVEIEKVLTKTIREAILNGGRSL